MRPITYSKLNGALIAGLFTIAACGEAPQSGGSQAGCTSRSDYADSIGGPFNLIDHTDRSVTEADFSDKANLVYFGFTYCPDVCPFTLVTINQALDQLPDDMERPRTLLISVDPDRDTPEALATYIGNEAFPDDIVGLTGPPERIKAVADAFFASYSKIDLPESAAGYTMDHTSILYLMDENWKLKTFFTGETTPGDMASCLAEQLG